MNRHWIALFVAATCISRAAVTCGQEWGNLSGKFIYDSKGPPPAPKVLPVVGVAFGPVVDESLLVGQNHEFANVIVWLQTKDVTIHPDYEKTARDKVLLDAQKFRFNPHVVSIRTTQTLEMRNSDPRPNSILFDSPANYSFNEVLQPGKSVFKPLSAPEGLPFEARSAICPWMHAWVLVRPNPYIAVSGDDGKFEIKDLPAGAELEFRVWHERAGYIQKATIDDKDIQWSFDPSKGKRYSFRYVLKPGNNDLGEVRLSPDQFDR